MDSQTAIVAPVMRFIGVANVAKSAAFYRDVLGFEIREEAGRVEAVCGPARLQFGAQDYAPGHVEEQRPFGSAMIFFHTSDVGAIQAAIRKRGGATSEIEKVNWIKLRLFAVRDPDGHTLWFGQSYAEPFDSRPAGMMQKTLPHLPVVDVGAAVAHYRDVLGFHINHQQDDLGVMDRDQISVLLIPRTEQRTGIGSTYVYVENADALYAELRAKGAHVQGEPVSHPWGLRDFAVLDPDGNALWFGQPFE
jgi:catechol 2,3-dioxygenase-like lactoylglutathione lyase family enzyme